MKPIQIAIAVMALALVGVWGINFLLTPDYANRLYDEPPAEAATVIFVGNSHTSVNHLPNMVERLADADEGHRPMWVQMHAPGGWSLPEHVHHGGAAQMMDIFDADYVVIQGVSVGPLVWPDDYLEGFFELSKLASQSGAQAILYQPWPRHPERDAWDTYAQPETPDDIDGAFAKIEAITQRGVDESSAIMAAVGRAWEEVRLSAQPIDLYDDDGNHANEAGTYLAALVIYGTMRDSALPVEPWRPSSISDEKATALREVAQQVLADQKPSE